MLTEWHAGVCLVHPRQVGAVTDRDLGLESHAAGWKNMPRQLQSTYGRHCPNLPEPYDDRLKLAHTDLSNIALPTSER